MANFRQWFGRMLFENLAHSENMVSEEGFDAIIDAAKKMGDLPLLYRGTKTPYPMLMRFKDVPDRGMDFYGLMSTHTVKDPHPITKGILNKLGIKYAPIFASSFRDRALFFGGKVRFLIPAKNGNVLWSALVTDLAEYTWKFNKTQFGKLELNIPDEQIPVEIKKAADSYEKWKGQRSDEVLVLGGHYFMVDTVIENYGGPVPTGRATYADLVKVLEAAKKSILGTQRGTVESEKPMTDTERSYLKRHSKIS